MKPDLFNFTVLPQKRAYYDDNNSFKVGLIWMSIF